MNIKTLIAVGASLFLLACSERNLEYYEKNISKAEEKTQECDLELEAAMTANNVKAMKEISSNQECAFAYTALIAHKKRIRQAEREIKRKKREAEKLAAQKIYDQEYSKNLEAFKTLKYSEFVAMSKECNSFYHGQATARCKAYKELKVERETSEINKLKSQYKDGQLEEFKASSCEGLKYDETMCALSKKASRNQQAEKVQYYLDNRENLKTVFNKCHQEYILLYKAGKYKAANNAARKYECKLVGDAAKKLKVWNFKKPIG